jgi:hypothetical protein
MDTADLAAIVISLFALAGTGLGLWFSKDANRISKESKELAREANDIVRESNETAKKSFEAENIPAIQISLGSGQDLTTSPPATLFEIQAGNHGRLPVVIQHVGVAIVGLAGSIPLVHAVVDKQDLHSKLPDVLPYEVLPGRVLDIPVPMEHLRKSLAINTKSPDDQFTVRLYQPTGQFFESFAQPVAPFIDGEPPLWVRFHKEPPPQASDAAEPSKTPPG